ncbi:MAG: amidohydrolase family protein [Opitutales bacterium]
MPADVITHACILNPLSDTQCDCFVDGALAWNRVSRSGGAEILLVGTREAVATAHQDSRTVVEDHTGQLLMPGFFDTHFHWVQDSVREAPKSSLLYWLDNYTFPVEQQFADPEFAGAQAGVFWKRILSVGTLGGACYSSVHPQATAIALEHARGHFRVGNALMSMNCPEALRMDSAELLRGAQALHERFGDRYIVSPRFAPMTDPELMRQACALAWQSGSFCQTHMDETQQEIAWVLGIYRALEGFGDVDTYTEIYRRCEVLGPRTLLGHCIHLEDSEWTLLRQSDSAITHCPTSNAPIEQRGLGSGLFDFRRAESEGVRWALASDIGGGPYLSMFDVMASFVRQNNEAGIAEATFTKALYRATQAGADLLGLGAQVGNLTPGKEASFIVIENKPELPDSSPEALLRWIASLGVGDRNRFDSLLERTVLDGQTVHRRL